MLVQSTLMPCPHEPGWHGHDTLLASGLQYQLRSKACSWCQELVVAPKPKPQVMPDMRLGQARADTGFQLGFRMLVPAEIHPLARHAHLARAHVDSLWIASCGG